MIYLKFLSLKPKIAIIITTVVSKQGASAGDRVYGLLFMPNPAGNGSKINLAVEAVRNGFATPKVFGPEETDDLADVDETDPIRNYEKSLQSAYAEARTAKVGVHADVPLVRKLQNAGDDFNTLTLFEKSKKFCDKGSVLCTIEYCFDGSRFRCMVTDPDMEPTGLQYGSFTLILAGVTCPRPGNPRIKPPTESEPFADEAKSFVDMRLLHRELKVTLHGTDKSGVCAVGTIHHPLGNSGVELLKKGYGRVSDWSARLMNPLDVPAFRVAENNAKVRFYRFIYYYRIAIKSMNNLSPYNLIHFTHHVLFHLQNFVTCIACKFGHLV